MHNSPQINCKFDQIRNVTLLVLSRPQSKSSADEKICAVFTSNACKTSEFVDVKYFNGVGSNYMITVLNGVLLSDLFLCCYTNVNIYCTVTDWMHRKHSCSVDPDFTNTQFMSEY